ncbi:hypothetical protein ACFWU3_08585 [Streptomyces sp. NPDC058685]|uniref:hypothetical protein n=1 Tax=Streptomyces sp. NPDC058685 TaxID=3346598 RepID=UPI00364B5DA7
MRADSCSLDAVALPPADSRYDWNEQWTPEGPAHARTPVLTRVRTAMLGTGIALVLGALVSSVALAGGGDGTSEYTPLDGDLGGRPNLITPAAPPPAPSPSATSRTPSPDRTREVVPATERRREPTPTPTKSTTPEPTPSATPTVGASIQPWPEYTWRDEDDDDWRDDDDCRDGQYGDRDGHHHDHGCW